MMFKRGQKVVLFEHDGESEMNLSIGDVGVVEKEDPNWNGWVSCRWDGADHEHWWVDPKCLKAARPISLENK